MSLVSLIKGRGPSGFGAGSTAEEVTAGLDLTGRTYLITGSNSGLGEETMRVLALRGARVVALARTLEKARASAAAVGVTNVLPLACELSDPASVRACVQALRTGGIQLDAIICNAGVMAMPKLQQASGVELQFFTNHVGHFQLVTGLIEQLTPAGRVVMLSSDAHKMAPSVGIDFDNLSGERGYSAWRAYGQSKLANILFAKELARRFQGTQRTANALHPGVIVTNLWRHMPELGARLFKSITPLFLKTPAEGAATSCYVATHPSLSQVSGQYFADVNVAKPTRIAGDAELAKRLWTETEAILARIPQSADASRSA